MDKEEEGREREGGKGKRETKKIIFEINIIIN